uniref:F-box domain-containing protein n=1 Tax=Mycena chlorophos TaxID=658473 RepID=A0ABQ0M8G3_MYCCL|nr:predicted protein [Mycena chlorophos]
MAASELENLKLNVSVRAKLRLQKSPQLRGFPVHLLPVEIAAEIFLLCIPPPGPDWDETVHPNVPPLLLLRICRSWRRIALSTPRLWATFRLRHRHHQRFVSPPRDRKQFQRLADLLDTWVERAGGVAISLDPDLAKVDLKRAPETIAPLVHSFRRNSSNIGHLAFTCDVEELAAFDRLGLHFPRLETLSLMLRGHLADSESEITQFRDCPLLRRVHIKGIPVSRIRLPWSQLSQLRTYFYPAKTTLEILEKAPNLASAILHTRRLTDDYKTGLPTLKHEALCDLTVEDDFESVFGEYPSLLPFLTLPVLVRLGVNLGYRGSFDLQEIESLVKRSGCNLQRLKLNMSPGRPLASPESFAALSSLTHLEFDRPDGEILTVLFSSYGSDPAFLPRLEDLQLVNICREIRSDTLSVSAEALHRRQAAVVQSCGPTGTKMLRSFCMQFFVGGFGDSNIESIAPDLLRLVALRKTGLELYVGTSHMSFV